MDIRLRQTFREKWSGRLDPNQRPPHPQCDALPGCATPRLAGASRQAGHARQGARGSRVWLGAGEKVTGEASAGSVSRFSPSCGLSFRGAGRIAGAGQPRLGRTGAGHHGLPGRQRHPRGPVYADQGAGSQLGTAFPQRDFAAADPGAGFIAFGAGEENVYLNTPTWGDITPRTLFSALAGGQRVMHVGIEPSPAFSARIRLGRKSIGGCGRRSAPISCSTRTGSHGGSIIRAMDRPTLFISPGVSKASSAPTTTASPPGFGWPGSRPAPGRRS